MMLENLAPYGERVGSGQVRLEGVNSPGLFFSEDLNYFRNDILL